MLTGIGLAFLTTSPLLALSFSFPFNTKMGNASNVDYVSDDVQGLLMSQTRTIQDDKELPDSDTLTVALASRVSFEEASNELAQQKEIPQIIQSYREDFHCRPEAQFPLFGMLPVEIRNAI